MRLEDQRASQNVKTVAACVPPEDAWAADWGSARS